MIWGITSKSLCCSRLAQKCDPVVLLPLRHSFSDCLGRGSFCRGRRDLLDVDAQLARDRGHQLGEQGRVPRVGRRDERRELPDDRKL